MSNIECSYCGSIWRETKKGNCVSCGAPNKIQKIERYDPIFYDGYIIYAIRDYSRRAFEFVFYKGITLMGDIFVSDRELMEIPPTTDYMPIVMEKLKNVQQQV